MSTMAAAAAAAPYDDDAVVASPIDSQAAERGAKKLAALFSAPTESCTRCGRVVYPTERVRSGRDSLFHKRCFSCKTCGIMVTPAGHKTSANRDDPEIYCAAHVPKQQHGSVGMDSRGVLSALEATRLRERLNRIQTIRGPRFGVEASFIQHAIKSQDLNKGADKGDMQEHHFPAVLIQCHDELQQKLKHAQEELERRQREEEAKLLMSFQEERQQMALVMQKEVEDDWEGRLKEITFNLEVKFPKKKGKDYQMTKMQLEEDAKRDLKEKHAQQLKNKTVRIIQKQQEATSDMVEKQKVEMLLLMKEAQEEVQTTLAVVKHEIATKKMNEGEIREFKTMTGTDFGAMQPEEFMRALVVQTEAPPVRPPRSFKHQLYHNQTAEEIFQDLDDYVVNIAETEQTTFTDLVSDLTGDLLSDLAKARAVYRWITVKDLNSLRFADANKDSPMDLLRGIKFGTETYHTLFKRLCSYAGLHCVEVRGVSKSVGYEPGMPFRGEMFRNTWNAVLIDGQWRLVQCNWGARHLLLNKDADAAEGEKTLKKKDKIRYQYDDHYFLTDPEEFVYEFLPDDPKWQLLEQPITLPEFEARPFVRSIFFKFGMRFKDNYGAIVYADENGGAEVRIIVPEDIANDIVFHYQLRYAPKELRHETTHKGARLDRFVFQSILDNEVIYSVHVPTKGEFFLEIFATLLEEGDFNEGLDDSSSPLRLKCACKFRIICNELKHKMHPLPNCATGEWGPAKAVRHFRIFPVSHPTGVINCNDSVEVKMTTRRPYVYLVKLRMNGIDDGFLDQFVRVYTFGDDLVVTVSFPIPGQYGLDIYARPDEDAALSEYSDSTSVMLTGDQTLAHACKYLINVGSVKHRIDLGAARVENVAAICRDRWGAQVACKKLGISPLSHPDAKIVNPTGGRLVIDFDVPPQVSLSFHFIREPDEDYRDHVGLTREDETGRLARFVVPLIKPGHYLLALFGREEREDTFKLRNFFNYLILYDPEATFTRKKKSLLKGLSISSQEQ